MQKRAEPAFKRANEAYVAFSSRGRDDQLAKPEGSATGKPAEIAAADKSIRTTGAQIARLKPPQEGPGAASQGPAGLRSEHEDGA
ncbi:MAG: hypothetical protein H0W96_01935 [Solirubrobacterales bacterium]|nr:hypothetical protein [Solirubrobacterales bacterium]